MLAQPHRLAGAALGSSHSTGDLEGFWVHVTALEGTDQVHDHCVQSIAESLRLPHVWARADTQGKELTGHSRSHFVTNNAVVCSSSPQHADVQLDARRRCQRRLWLYARNRHGAQSIAKERRSLRDLALSLPFISIFTFGTRVKAFLPLLRCR